jgi:DNA-binding transcriptional regulator YiaG
MVKKKEIADNECKVTIESDTAINDRIKQVRKALQMSQVQFCKGIFLTDGHYAGIELGNRRVME